MTQLAIPSPGICPREVEMVKKTKNCTQMFIAAFNTISKNNHPPTGEWIHNGLLFSNEKRQTIDLYIPKNIEEI